MMPLNQDPDPLRCGGGFVRFRLLFALLLLVACGDVSAPVELPPTPTPLVFTTMGDVLGRNLPLSGAEITTIGYVIVDEAGARLLDGLSFSAGPTPQPLSQAAGQIWLGTDVVRALGGLLQRAGDLRYAVVLAHGRLVGPGVYGPDGSYRYQMNEPRLQMLAPEETSIATLLDNSTAYEGRLVRVAGGLLTRADSALLVERLGSGGLPAPNARQIKLRAPLRDQALLSRLNGSPNGAIHFGQVQVEGFWRGGALTPLSLLPIS
jgi:hypothetical protein